MLDSRRRVRCPPTVAQVLVIISVACAPSLAGVTSVHSDFESDPSAEGWGSTTPLGDPGNQWTSEDSHSGTHSLRVEEGLWVSPIIDLEPFEYYSISLQTRMSGSGYYGPSYKTTTLYADGTEWNSNVSVFRGRHDRAETRIYFRPSTGGPGYLDDVVIEPIGRGQATAILDERWSSQAPLATGVGQASNPNLRRTFRALENGENMRVVMLGDSIVDDMSHSYFELFLERMYPGARIDVVTSTRNSTGCWWFRETEPETGIPRVTTWVTDFAPDLVLIGGISHGQGGLQAEIDATRDVIEQIRAWNADTDILLVTPVGGTMDPRERPHLLDRADPDGPDWRARLYRLAMSEHVGYLDMTTLWARHIESTGRPTSAFLRDSIHLNERGAAVAGRILETWFSPERKSRPGRSRGDSPRRSVAGRAGRIHDSGGER